MMTVRDTLAPLPLLPLLLLTVTKCDAQVYLLPAHSVRVELLSVFGDAISSVLDTVHGERCFPLLLTDGTTSSTTIYQISEAWPWAWQWGEGVFEMAPDGQGANQTHYHLASVVAQARLLRQRWWCVTVVVVSESQDFLADFAQWSLRGRLLVWSTRLVVLTRLPRDHINALFASYWTYAMTNAVVLNADLSTYRCDVYCLVPYSAEGRQVIRLATWTPTTGLTQLTSLNMFCEKYKNFYGRRVNVTALQYEPYWMASQQGNTTTYSGIDYQQLATLSQALNFTIHVLPSHNWAQVTDQVEARTSFLASIVYVVLPNRLLRWDYTCYFDHSPLTFAMAKPLLRPSWVSCYYPFSHGVWAAVFVSALLICLTLIKITRTETWMRWHGRMSSGEVVLEVVGSLLGQGLRSHRSARRSNHVLMAAWLSLGVVVGAAYNSSLIASLTLPRRPHRPETLQELVAAVDRVTMESYGISFKKFFLESEYSVFRALGRLIHLNVSVMDGLKQTITTKQAQIGSKQNLEMMVAQHFTGMDRSTPLYVARVNIIPSISAWPLPHDAPYKHAFDKIIRTVTESGLYMHWMEEAVHDAERKSRLMKRRMLVQQRDDPRSKESREATDTKSNSLTVTHIQGPLLLLILGLTLAALTFVMEKFIIPVYFHNDKKGEECLAKWNTSA